MTYHWKVEVPVLVLEATVLEATVLEATVLEAMDLVQVLGAAIIFAYYRATAATCHGATCLHISSPLAVLAQVPITASFGVFA
eukprot:CAMPEP_0172656164 /NCGR_PEP_ID=MMETSP1074-20121228/1172_1 /TAXON_ID=2916 /ORGANISM="Ceratium fusus, Strain PA161109" /LENGTH=82 /DNA_ID=CAMNT_0013470951 /DNA_START=64 /DNA_END=313 /DNA_ORIENTATION=-